MHSLYMKSLKIYRIHHTITKEKIRAAFQMVLGGDYIKYIHQWPKIDRKTREKYFTIVIIFKRQNFSGHPAEKNVVSINSQLENGNFIRVFYNDQVNPYGYFMKCYQHEFIVRRDGTHVPELFRGQVSDCNDTSQDKQNLNNICKSLVKKSTNNQLALPLGCIFW